MVSTVCLTDWSAIFFFCMMKMYLLDSRNRLPVSFNQAVSTFRKVISAFKTPNRLQNISSPWQLILDLFFAYKGINRYLSMVQMLQCPFHIIYCFLGSDTFILEQSATKPCKMFLVLYLNCTLPYAIYTRARMVFLFPGRASFPID